ncbi:D-serine dehydratase transcriptional activator [Klebsiella grimontii]|nr:D-serine dehydratase transcriptional activator [Klebsiella grimontii]
MRANGCSGRWKSSLGSLNQEILDIKNQELSGTLTVYSRRPSPSAGWCPRSAILPPLSVDLAYRADRQR